MASPEDDLASSQALVIDSNPTSRAILVSQLRDFGVGRVVQCSRLTEARRQLEYQTFDVVLCEHHFGDGSTSGQDLLDDLRRNQILPFSTVFIMVTGEATYAKVAEAAESALDGYLLKPHSASNLEERLRQARIRKISLGEIFSAIEAEDFQLAAELCLERFNTQGEFWLYAARIGAELLLRLERYAAAQRLYAAVIAAKTLPWAKLGVARSLLEAGQKTQAVSILEKLIGEDPDYADAYDVLGRAQFELGNFDQALATYKMASELTPSSISRLQNLGMMTFYSGDRAEAEKILARTTRLGRDSKMFDCQTLVLLAFAHLESEDKKGLKRCRDDFKQILEKNPDNARNQRLSGIVEALVLIQDRQFARVVQAVRALVTGVRTPGFDFEAASNLLALMGQLANKAIQLDEVESVIDTLGMRFCTSRSLTELLAGAAAIHPPYAERVRACHAQVVKITESALTLSLEGDPTAAVKSLIFHGNATLNARLIETAHLVLQRYESKIEQTQELAQTIRDLRTRFGSVSTRSTALEQARQTGGAILLTAGRVTPESP